MTEWRPVPSLEGRYEVSDDGQVRTIPRILKPYRSKKDGYDSVVLDGQTVTIHRLVAQAFLGNPRGKKVVHHKNKIRHDNRVENLEWTTHGENNKYAWENGRIAPRQREVRGWLNPNRTGQHFTYPSAAAAARKWGVSKEAIARAARLGKQCAGVWWLYS